MNAATSSTRLAPSAMMNHTVEIDRFAVSSGLIEEGLDSLIARHSEAAAHFAKACDLADEYHADFDPDFAGWEAASDAEEAARLALLSYHCRDMREIWRKAAHFAARLRPDHGDFEDAWAGRALMLSMLEPGASL